MARLLRAEVFDPNEVAVFRVFNRTVKRCFLMGSEMLKGQSIRYQGRGSPHQRGGKQEEDDARTRHKNGSGEHKCPVPTTQNRVPTRCRRHLGQPGSCQTLVDALPRAPFGRFKTPATKLGRDQFDRELSRQMPGNSKTLIQFQLVDATALSACRTAGKQRGKRGVEGFFRIGTVRHA
jgi:hypothetical protein